MEKKSSMEDVFRRSKSQQGATANEKRRVDYVGDNHKEEIAMKIGEKRPYNDMNQSSAKQNQYLSCSKQKLVLTKRKGFSLGPDSRPSSSNQKEQDDQLETARAEMGEVRQQNQRLKMYLDRIMKDYQTLQMQFVNIVKQEAKKKSTDTSNDEQEIEEHHELVSLNLGRFSSSSSDSKKNEKNESKACLVEEGLSLALDSKFEASKSDSEAGEIWSPSKGLDKTMRSGDDEILQQSPVKKARVSVRARCDTPTMNDGCQWRKYGQKIAKGNPCPRAYYRCTIAPSCPVRKKVQRCVEDMSILITTYEGTHNHPLPVSATAMASTTSAAASMLLSSSSSSSSGTAPSNLHGLNSLSLSTSPLHPTITLDLTTPLISRFTSNYPQGPRYSSTNLNFNSSESSSWGSSNGRLFSHGSNTQPYMKNNQIGYLNLGRKPIENIYQSYMQNPNPNLHQQSFPADSDTIAAATEAITADPSFQSALATALKSIIGNQGRL